MRDQAILKKLEKLLNLMVSWDLPTKFHENVLMIWVILLKKIPKESNQHSVYPDAGQVATDPSYPKCSYVTSVELYVHMN